MLLVKQHNTLNAKTDTTPNLA